MKKHLRLFTDEEHFKVLHERIKNSLWFFRAEHSLENPQSGSYCKRFKLEPSTFLKNHWSTLCSDSVQTLRWSGSYLEYPCFIVTYEIYNICVEIANISHCFAAIKQGIIAYIAYGRCTNLNSWYTYKISSTCLFLAKHSILDSLLQPTQTNWISVLVTFGRKRFAFSEQARVNYLSTLMQTRFQIVLVPSATQ